MPDSDSEDIDIISYNLWIKENIKKIKWLIYNMLLPNNLHTNYQKQMIVSYDYLLFSQNGNQLIF